MIFDKFPSWVIGRSKYDFVELGRGTARATGLLTKVGSGLDAACGAVGSAVASDVRGEYT